MIQYEKQNPLLFLKIARKEKYKFLSVPIVVILINFVLILKYQTPYVEYISTVFFILYLFISYFYKIEKPNIEINESNLLAPITGKVKKVTFNQDNYSIIIQKPLFSTCEIRTMTNTDSINSLSENSEVSWAIKSSRVKIFSDKSPHPQGQLIGINAGACELCVIIPLEYELSVVEGQHLICGKSILATSKKSSSTSNEGRDYE